MPTGWDCYMVDYSRAAQNDAIMSDYRRKILAKGVFDGGSKYLELMAKKRRTLPRAYLS